VLTNALRNESLSFAPSEIRARRHALYEIMAALGLDAVVVASESNMIYLSGYITTSWANKSRPLLLVLSPGRETVGILSDGEIPRFNADAVEATAIGFASVRASDSQDGFIGPATRTLVSLLQRNHAKHIGLELGSYFLPCLPQQAIDELRLAMEGSGGRIVDISSSLWALRRRKSALEINLLRESATVLGKAYELFQTDARVGMTERELAACFAVSAISAGADRVGYLSVVSDTNRGSLGGPTQRAWTGDTLLLIDAGIVLNGYWADFNRIFTAGSPTPAETEAYTTLTAALDAGRKAAGPLVRCNTLAQALAGAIEEGLFGRAGHGIGLDLTEPPSVAASEGLLLEPGMTLCLEPNRTQPGVGSMVAEEEIVITDAGAELISPEFPRSLPVLSS
jgi:Xaa-Pro aminopeptidase